MACNLLDLKRPMTLQSLFFREISPFATRKINSKQILTLSFTSLKLNLRQNLTIKRLGLSLSISSFV